MFEAVMATVCHNKAIRPLCARQIAGNVDFHFFIKYEWAAGLNDAANSALAQKHISLMAPYMISTQVILRLCIVL